jgi:hypothetical protein
MTDLTHIGDASVSVVAGLGIYAGVPIERYHNDTDLFVGPHNGFSISSTGLRKFVSRPSEYWCESPFNPGRFETESKDYFEFGKAAHHLLLGEQGFAERFVLRPEELDDKPWQTNRTVCKVWVQARKDEGKSVITAADLEKIKWMADALHTHPMVQAGILSGKVERSLMVRNGGIWLRNRPDNLPLSGGDIVDLKTAADVSTDGISKTIYGAGYHIQAAVARLAYETIFGTGSFNSFSFVFIEKTPPFDVRVMQLKDTDIDRGTQQIMQALPLLEKCLEKNEWPGYDGFGQDAGWIEMPMWAKTRIDDSLKLGTQV